MNNLLKTLAFASSFATAVIMPVACSSSTDEDPEIKQNFDIKGKVFVNEYEEEDKNVHVAGTEILEFKTSDSVVRYNVFCILAGDYLKLSDYEERGRYGVVDNAVMIGLGDSLQTASLYIDDEGKPVLNWPGLGEYKYSKLSVEGNKKHFERLHTHELVDPRVTPGDSVLTVSSNGRYLACTDRKSFIMNVDSLSGSRASHNQKVSFTIKGLPGEFELSEETGNIYLMKFGSMAYAPVSKEIADSNPKDVVAILINDAKYDDYTIVCPGAVGEFKGKGKHTTFATLNPLLY